jgi:branched-subunit amino acid transport protein
VTVNPKILLLIIGMGLVTYVPRWFPLFFLSTRRLPRWLEIWLDFIPVAVLGALIVPALAVSGDPRHLDLLRKEMIVGIPVFLFALKTRSMGATVLVGMALYWLAGKFL